MNGDTETYLFAPFIKMGRFIESVKPSFSLKPHFAESKFTEIKFSKNARSFHF